MILIKNGLVYTMEKDEPEILDILVGDDGLIKEVNSSITGDYEVIDATDKIVYPGIIEAHSHLGISESSIGFEGNDTNEMTDPITPHVRAIDGINIFDETVRIANENGITTTCCTPGSANVIGGQTCIYKTYGTSLDKVTIDPYNAMKCAYGENPKRVYQDSKIKTRMGTAALMRQALFEAQEYLVQKELAKDDVSKAPKFNMKNEAMIPVLKREVPLKSHAHRADDIQTILRIAKEFNVDVTLEHCTDGHLIAEEIKESNFSAVVGPTLTHKTKFELKNRTFKTPNELYKAGVLFAITTDAPVVPIEYLPLCAGLAHRAGLPEIEALKSITINAAKILKQDHRIGSIKVGKDADIIICDGNILDNLTSVLCTITDGNITSNKL